MLPGLLVGGLVPGPWLDTGERIGDGDLFILEAGSDAMPVRLILSRTIGLVAEACSDRTTSANEINDRRRTNRLRSTSLALAL